jgi:hypothetical protein
MRSSSPGVFKLLRVLSIVADHKEVRKYLNKCRPQKLPYVTPPVPQKTKIILTLKRPTQSYDHAIHNYFAVD